MEAQIVVSPRARIDRSLSGRSIRGDERLARSVAGSGGERAFAALYERYHQPLYRYCRSILGNDTDAQDALQSTFAAAFAALRRGQRDAPVRPWLFRIAHNESVSALRRRRPVEELLEQHEDPMLSVEERAEERGRLAMLLADLRELPERQRDALVMRELSGLTHEEIALALGTTVGAAKQTIYEARRSIFQFAEGRAMRCEEIQRAISDGDGRGLRSRRVRAHLRDCRDCATFAAAIPARTADLRALAPPLPALAAAGVLGRVLGGASGHGGGSAGGVAGGVAGKTVGAALATKTLTGVAIVAATAGLATALRHAHSTHRPSATPTARARHAGGGPLITNGERRSRGGATAASRVREHHAIAARAARARAATGTRSHHQAAAASRGQRGRSGKSHSGGTTAPAGATTAPSTSTPSVVHTPSRSSGVSHRSGSSTSVSAGRPQHAHPGGHSGSPTTRSGAGNGQSRVATGSRPATLPVPTATSPGVPLSAPSASTHAPSGAGASRP